jgi:hypothetical protein
MDLLFGTDVREYGQYVGRLAGFELDSATHRVRNIVFSPDGSLGNHIVTRPFDSVLIEPGEIDIRPYTPAEAKEEGPAILVGHGARILRGGRDVGRVAGFEVAVGSGELEGIIGRRSWWTRRFRLDPAGLDFSVPGQVRTAAAGSRAA